mgnify:CR=1 FL=1
MKNYLVYVAGPYSAPTINEIDENVRKAIKMGEQITKVENCIPFVPHLFHWWEKLHPHPYEFWLDLDLKMLEKCDILFRIEGKSKGADAELEFAKANNIPYVYSIEELDKLVYKAISRCRDRKLGLVDYEWEAVTEKLCGEDGYQDEINKVCETEQQGCRDVSEIGYKFLDAYAAEIFNGTYGDKL